LEPVINISNKRTQHVQASTMNIKYNLREQEDKVRSGQKSCEPTNQRQRRGRL
jgi:hypothetical protein